MKLLKPILALAAFLLIQGCAMTKAGHETARQRMTNETQRVMSEHQTERHWNQLQAELKMIDQLHPTPLFEMEGEFNGRIVVNNPHVQYQIQEFKRFVRKSKATEFGQMMWDGLNSPFGTLLGLGWIINMVDSNSSSGGGGGSSPPPADTGSSLPTQNLTSPLLTF